MGNNSYLEVISLYVNVQTENKIVELWLTRTEREDKAFRASLALLYQKYNAKGFLVVVFLSGDEDLYPQTRDLLLYNQRRLAELSVQAAKQETMLG